MTIAESWHDLEADLLGPEPDYDNEPPVELDRTTADRYLRRIAHLDERYASDKEVAEAQIEQVRAWLAGRYATYDAQRGWLHSTLRRFHEALLALDPKTKTVTLPVGKTKMRAQPLAWTVDGDEYLPWAQEHAADTVRTIPESKAVDMNAVKRLLAPTKDGRAVTPDGEVAPGVTVTENAPKFSVEIATEHDAPAPDPAAIAAAMTEPF